MHTICFIGAGNMAHSLIGGLIASGFPATHIRASNPDTARLEELKKTFGIYTTTDNVDAATPAQVIVLCVKPKLVTELCKTHSTLFQQKNKLLISIAAGITTHAIEKAIGHSVPIVRTMPNTPALVRAGMTGLFATAAVTQAQHILAEELMRAVGYTLWVKEEKQLDAITALSGSGPAYFLLFMETLREAGEKIGLTKEASQFLVLQTALGSAKLAFESNEDWQTLREKITSPGGTTEQAIQVFTPTLFQLCEDAVRAAFLKAEALSM